MSMTQTTEVFVANLQEARSCLNGPTLAIRNTWYALAVADVDSSSDRTF